MCFTITWEGRKQGVDEEAKTEPEHGRNCGGWTSLGLITPPSPLSYVFKFSQQNVFKAFRNLIVKWLIGYYQER